MDDPRPRPNYLRWGISSLLVLGVLAFVAWRAFGWFKDFAVFRTFNFALDSITDATGASPYLVKGVLILVMTPFFLALREIGKLWPFTAAGLMPKKVAWGIAIVYVAGFFLVMHVASRDQYFHHNSRTVEATKFYAITPEGIRFFDTSGVDPKYGIPLRPVTPELIANVKRRELGLAPKLIVYEDPSEIVFFDTLTGEPKVWYLRNDSGQIELFSSGGFHPAYSAGLKPVTKEVVAEVGRQAKERSGKERQDKEASIAAARRSAADAYVGPAVDSKDKGKTAAVLVLANDASGVNLEESIQQALLARRVEPIRGFFKPAFIQSGKAAALFDGDWGVAQDLLLSERVGVVVIGRTASTVTANDQFEGLKTASVQLDIKCLQLEPQRSCGARSISVKGAGYGDVAAVESALANAKAQMEEAVMAFGL